MSLPYPAESARGHITVQRPGDHELVLTLPAGGGLESIAAKLPYAREITPGTWKVALCHESASVLIGLERQGTVSTDLSRLIGDADNYASCHDGMVLPYHSDTYPYSIWSAWGDNDDPLVARIPGGYERKGSNGLVYPVPSGGAIARLVYEGTLSDPQGVFPRSEAVVGYDSTTGEFFSAGDERVEQSLDRFFPQKDVVAAARNHGVDVQFSDPFSEEVYRGELARHGEGIQPDGITLQLFPYQRTAVAQLLERSGLGVFLAPGLGKTLVATAAGHELLNRGMVDRVVVTPPAAVAAQWEEEIRRFTGGGPDAVVRVQGTPAKRKEQLERAQSAPWVIVHHDLLTREAQDVRRLVSGAAIVFDEAHKGANASTKRGEEMAKLARIAERRISMTGTPVLNDVPEWFSVLGRLTVPGLFGSGREFCGRYQYPNVYGHGYEGSRRLDELAARSRAHFIRYTKDEVAQHLPPLQVRHMPVKTDPEYRKVLTTAHLNAADELTDHYDHVEDSEAVGQMTAYGMLRALCSSPRLIHVSDSDGAKALVNSGVIPDEDGPKVDKVRQVAKAMQDRGERIVMFTFSRSLVKLIAERFDEDGIRYVTYHGETPDKEREAAVRAFQTVADRDEDNPTVFLATDAAAEGLNLGHQCATLLNIDTPWTAGRLDQRFNRIHRVDGTHSSYLAVNMTIQGTVEDSILRKVEAKAGIADVLFGERSAQEITGRGSATEGQRAIRDAVRDWKRREVHTKST